MRTNQRKKRRRKRMEMGTRTARRVDQAAPTVKEVLKATRTT